MSDNTSILVPAGTSGVTAFRFVKSGTAGVADEAQDVAPTVVIMGVCYTTAASGEEVSVVTSGYCDVHFAEAVAPGAKITNNNKGKAVEATAIASDLIFGEYAPLPVSGTRPNSSADGIGRILLYANKLTVAI